MTFGLIEPTPENLKLLRTEAGLTQKEAAHLVGLNHNYRWSEFERGALQISAERWELFLIKTGNHPEYIRRKSIPAHAFEPITHAS